ALLLGREVPVGVETVRIAGGQEELLGSVGFGEVLGLGWRLCGGWLRAEGELLGRGLGRRRRGRVAFKEERWDFQRRPRPTGTLATRSGGSAGRLFGLTRSRFRSFHTIEFPPPRGVGLALIPRKLGRKQRPRNREIGRKQAGKGSS